MAECANVDELVRDAEHRYRLITENATDLIWTASLGSALVLPDRLDRAAALEIAGELLSGFHFSYVSPSVRRVLGYEVGEAMALGLKQLLTSESFAQAQQLLAEELLLEVQPGKDLQRSRVVELQHIAKDGRARCVEVHASFLRNAEGRTTAMLGVSRDATEQRQADRALRESEAALRELVQNIPDLVLVVDWDGLIHYVNRSLGPASPAELVRRSGFGFMKPEYRNVCRRALRRACRTSQVQHVEMMDVFGLCWSCRVVPLVAEEGVPRAMLICADVTQQRKAEEAVGKEQELLRQVLDLFERDRQLVAFELHDGLAQQLIGALMNLEASAQLAATAPQHSRQTYREGLRLLRESIEEARRLMRGLHPPALVAFGLVSAIEHLIQENEAAGRPQIEFVASPEFQRLARPLENVIFRIVQETLTNARRHSGSDKVRVELVQQDNRVRLSVRDWGVGFDVNELRRDRFGLTGIRERARLFGGSALIDTAPGKGTCVTVELPLVPAPAEQPPADAGVEDCRPTWA